MAPPRPRGGIARSPPDAAGAAGPGRGALGTGPAPFRQAPAAACGTRRGTGPRHLLPGPAETSGEAAAYVAHLKPSRPVGNVELEGENPFSRFRKA